MEEHTGLGEIETFLEKVRNQAKQTDKASQCGADKIEVCDGKVWHLRGFYLCMASFLSHLYFPTFCFSFASFTAGGQVLDEVLLNCCDHGIRLNGDNFERRLGRKRMMMVGFKVLTKAFHSDHKHVLIDFQIQDEKFNINSAAFQTVCR